MTDLLVPDTMTLTGAGQALAHHLTISDRGASEVDRSYYDTFDGLLYERELSCVHEAGQLALVERATGHTVASTRAPLPTQPLLATELAAGALRDAIAPIIEPRALLPVVHVHARVGVLSVLDGAQKTVVRVTLEQPLVVSDGDVQRPLRPRARLTAVRGYEDELGAVEHTLEHELGFRPADQPLVDEAVRAAGGRLGGVSAKIDVPLSADERADVATAAVLVRLHEVIEANFDGTIADIDSEFLHDLRVAVRRTRSVLRECRSVFPPHELTYYRTEFRWLQQATGDVRDLDVYVLEFDRYRSMLPADMHSDLDPLLDVLQLRRRRARAQMTAALHSGRASTLLSGWGPFLDRLATAPDQNGPGAARPIVSLAGERISKVYRRMVKMGSAIDESSPPAEYHELRKKGKELRYLLELFGTPLYPHEVVKPMIKALKALQDVLGRHQDREVQVGMLRALRDELLGRPGGAAALMAMGVLVDRLGEDERAARADFAENFDEFAGHEQRDAVKETFA